MSKRGLIWLPFHRVISGIYFGVLAVAVFTSTLAALKLVVEPAISGGYSGYLPPSGGGGLSDTAIGPVYDASPFILPITWGAVAGTLIWKGKTKSVWKKYGYDYDTFKLVTRMRGSPKRVQLLGLVNLPKNKSQLASELGVDWRAVDNHIKALINGGLIEEMTTVGTSTYYIISDSGKRVLHLLLDDDHSKGIDGDIKSDKRQN